MLWQCDSGRGSYDVTRQHATWMCAGLRFPLWEPFQNQRLGLHVSMLCVGLLLSALPDNLPLPPLLQAQELQLALPQLIL